MKREAFLPLLLVVVLVGGCPTASTTTPGGEDVVVETVVANADFPVAAAFAPDGRMFFTEKATGQVRVIAEGVLAEEPVVTVPVNSVNERGLLGITLHPAFAENGWLYLFYSRAQASGGVEDNRVVRFTLEGNTAVDDETLIASLPTGDDLFRANHNGGNIRFGPDGKLYVAIGDVARSDTAQDPDARSGRILRYNDDGSVPTDNPFGETNPTFALGLRNPFDLAFDPVGTSLFATENGTTSHDEVNRIVSGGNYGWPDVQGDSGGQFDDPIIDETGSSVVPTGIDFAPNARYGAETTGDLFYGEYSMGRIWRVDLDATRSTVVGREVFASGLGALTDLVFAPDGTLYVLTRRAIFRVALATGTE